MHLGVVLARAAQDVNNLSHGILGVFRPFHNLHHGLVARLSLLQVGLRDEDGVGQRAVLGEQIGIFAAHLQRAYEGSVRTLNDFRHLCLAHMIPAAGQQGGLHDVAVHGMQAVAFGHQNGFAAIGRLQGVLSVRLAVEGAFQYLCGAVGHIYVALHLFNIVIQLQFVQNVQTEHFGGMRTQVQQAVDTL